MNSPSSEAPPPPLPHAQGHFALCFLSGITIYPPWGRVNGVIYALTDLGMSSLGDSVLGGRGLYSTLDPSVSTV